MSSTNRGGLRETSDYYKTPLKPIRDFLNAWNLDTCVLPSLSRILDPCAGGVEGKEGMSYPDVLSDICGKLVIIDTLDIRDDSPSMAQCDYLSAVLSYKGYDLVITNPPFYLALPIIQKALKDSAHYVVMLLRLNFFGTETRKLWWQSNMPEFTYVHAEHISFTGGQTDSIEYMHCVWNKLWHEKYTKLRII